MSLSEHFQYVHRVLRGDYSNDPTVPMDEPFINENGVIKNLVLGAFASSALITSRAKTIRANHRHKTDWHFTFVVSGKVSYYWRPESGILFSRDYHHGEMFFTPPQVAHAMVFPVDTTIITFARNLRDHDHHEEDVERVTIVTKDVFDGSL